jgi:hypothetical protein
MANIKISELPQVTSLLSTDLLPSVASLATSKVTVKNLADSLTQVSSSISASRAELSATASYYDTTGKNIVSSSLQFNNLTSPFTGSFTGSFSGDGSGLTGLSTVPFPYVGDAKITGSLTVSGSSTIINAIGVQITSSVIVDTGGIAADYIYPVNYAGFNWRDPSVSVNKKPGFTHFYPSNTNSGNGNDGSFTYYFADVNFGQRMQSSRAGVLKFSRDFAAVPDTRIYTLVSDGLNTSDNNTNIFGYNLYNNQYHVLTVTGSFRSVDNTSLGTYIDNRHIITGSTQITGSLSTIGNIQANSQGTGLIALGVTGSAILSNGSLRVSNSSTDVGGGFLVNPGSNFIRFSQPDVLNEFTIALSGSSAFSPSTAFTRISSTKGFQFITNTGTNLEVSSSFKVSGSADFNRGLTVTGSVEVTGSLTQNGFVVLTQVSQSLNFIDDSAAAVGGVPLGGLYRNGSAIAIRIA